MSRLSRIAVLEDDARRVQLIADLSTEGITIPSLASKWGVPVSTMGRWKLKGLPKSGKVGPEPILTRAGEAKIVDHLKWRADAAMPATAGDAIGFARDIARGMGIPESKFAGSRKWMRRLMARNPSITFRTPQTQILHRAAHFNRVNVEKFFGVAEPMLEQFTPENTYNGDDTSLVAGELQVHKVSPPAQAVDPAAPGAPITAYL